MRNENEGILDTSIVSPRGGGYQNYLAKWKNRTMLDCTLITDEEFQQHDCDLYNEYFSSTW